MDIVLLKVDVKDEQLISLEQRVQALKNTTLNFTINDSGLTNFIATVNKATESTETLGEKTEDAQVKVENFGKDAEGTVKTVQQYSNEAEEATKRTQSFGDSLTKRAVWQIASNMITKIANAIKEVVSTMKEVDTQLTNIQKVSQRSAEDLNRLGDAAYKVASQYGVAAEEYLSAVYTFEKAGLGDSAETLAEIAIKAQLVGDTTSDVAEKFLVAANAAWELNGSADALNKILDEADYVNNNYATTLDKIAAGLPIVASTAANAGMSMEETIAALGTITAVTQESGSKAATALRALILNIMGAAGEYEDGIEVTEESIKSLDTILQKYAGDAMAAADAAGKIINPMKAIAALAQANEKGYTNQKELFEVLSSLGGKLRTNQLTALVTNFDTLNQMMDDMANSAGTADAEVGDMLNSWESKVNILKNTWADFVQKTVDTGWVKGLIDAATGLLNIVGDLGNALGILGGLFVAFKADSIINSWERLTKRLKDVKQSLIDVKNAFLGNSAATKANEEALRTATAAVQAQEEATRLAKVAEEARTSGLVTETAATEAQKAADEAGEIAKKRLTEAEDAERKATEANTKAKKSAISAIGILITLISLAVTAIKSEHQKIVSETNELAATAKEAAEAAMENANSMVELAEKAKDPAVSQQELADSFYAVMDAMGNTRGETVALIRQYGSLQGAIDETTLKLLENAKAAADNNVLKQASKVTVNAGDWTGESDAKFARNGILESFYDALLAPVFGEWNGEINEFNAEIRKSFNMLTMSAEAMEKQNGVFEGYDLDSIVAYRDELQKTYDLMEEAVAKDPTLADNGVFQDVGLELGRLNGLLEDYDEAVDEAAQASARLAIATQENKIGAIDSADAFKLLYEETTKTASTSGTLGYVVDELRGKYPEYIGLMDDATSQMARMAVGEAQMAVGAIDSQEAFDALMDKAINMTSDLEAQGAIVEWLSALYPQFAEEVDGVTSAQSNASQSAREYYDVLETARERVTALKDAIAEQNEAGALSKSTLDSLLEQYPQLINALELTENGYRLNTSALEYLISAEVNDANVKLSDAKSAAQAVITAQSHVVKALNAETKGWDNNTKSVINNLKAKRAEYEAAATEAIKKGWYEKYLQNNSIAASYSKVIAALKTYNTQTATYEAYITGGGSSSKSSGSSSKSSGSSSKSSGSSSKSSGSSSKSSSTDTTDKQLEKLKSIVSLRESELKVLEAQDDTEKKRVSKIQHIQTAIMAEIKYLEKIGGDQEEINKLYADWYDWNTKIETIQKGIFNELEKAINAELDKEKDKLNNTLDRLNAQLDKAKSKLDDNLDSINAQIDALKKEKEYQEEVNEQAEKELAVRKAQDALDNAKKERTVRYYNAKTGKWEWGADANNVASAEEALKSAQDALADFEAESAYKARLAELEAQKDDENAKYDKKEAEIEAKIDAANAAYDKTEASWQKIIDSVQEPTKSISQVLKDIGQNATPDLKNTITTLNSLLKGFGYSISTANTTTTYTVKKGDTLTSIAGKYGTTAAKIASNNDISAASTLKVGQKLKIYDSGGILQGMGGIKATQDDEIVLPPDLVKFMLTPTADSVFKARMEELKYMYGASPKVPASLISTSRTSNDTHYNGDIYQYGNITLNEQQAKSTTVYQLAQLSRGLAIRKTGIN